MFSGTCRSLDRELGRSRWEHHWDTIQLTVENVPVPKLMTSGCIIWNKECRVITHEWLRDVDRHHDQAAVANIRSQCRVAMSYSQTATPRKLRAMGCRNAASRLQWRGRRRLVAGAKKTFALKNGAFGCKKDRKSFTEFSSEVSVRMIESAW